MISTTSTRQPAWRPHNPSPIVIQLLLFPVSMSRMVIYIAALGELWGRLLGSLRSPIRVCTQPHRGSLWSCLA